MLQPGITHADRVVKPRINGSRTYLNPSSSDCPAALITDVSTTASIAVPKYVIPSNVARG